MKKFLSVLLTTFLIISCQLANAKEIKFAQITDVMFQDESLPLEKVIQDINRTPDISFVVFTGNNIGKAKLNYLNNFLNEAKRLNKPYYIVLGNKDVSKTHDMDKKLYMKTVRKYNKTHPSTTNFVFKKGQLVFIVVDGSKELIPTPNGYYNKETMAWLDKTLTKYAKNKVVILQHFPLANKPKNELQYTYNTLEYIKMLNTHNNVIAIVSGHYNINDEIKYSDIYHITTPALGGGVYKIIDIDDNCGIYTILKDIRE